MEYRLGNSLRIKSKGVTHKLTCPKCHRLVQFGAFSNFERRLKSEFPLINFNTVYFLVCPDCASLYTVDDEIASNFRKNIENITEEDLKELSEFKNKL